MVELHAVGYCYLSRIASPAPGVTFSANYLDLRDGESATIRVSGLPEDFDPEKLLITRYASRDRDTIDAIEKRRPSVTKT